MSTTAKFRRMVAALPEPELVFLEHVGTTAVDALHRMAELQETGAAGAEVEDAIVDYRIATAAYHGAVHWLERFTP